MSDQHEPAARDTRGVSIPARVALGVIRAYQVVLSPVFGGQCRFYPSCSEYAVDAYRAWGAWRGTVLTVRRLARCHPLGGHGVDLVPPRPPGGSRGSGASSAGRDR